MTTEGLQRCLEEAFGNLEAPYFEEVFETYDIDGFGDAVKTDHARTKRWQELRPLRRYQMFGFAIHTLTPRAWQFYLPAYLYAMTDPDVVWCYLTSILDTLWYESQGGGALPNRDRWESRIALLTDNQKRCIANFLSELLRAIDDPAINLGEVEVDVEYGRIRRMLEVYWGSWLSFE